MDTALFIELLLGIVILIVLIANGGILMQMVQQQRRLLERIEEIELPGAQTGSTPVPSGLEIGTPAPNFTLPDLTGKLVNLVDFHGSQTLLLFWNPACSFCGQMVKDLIAWDANPPPEAPRLLVVSTGSVEANKAMSLRSTIVLDENFGIGSMYNAVGTPTSVLIDADGNIASKIAIGPLKVLKPAESDEVKTYSA